MKIKVFEVGETLIDADPDYTERAVRAALSDGDVADAIVDYTDTERSNISCDEYAAVFEDNGALVWHGWLTGLGADVPPPAQARHWLTGMSAGDRREAFAKEA